MLVFLLSFYGVCILLFIAMIFVEKMNQRREKDLEFDLKVTRIIKKTDPYIKFLYNVCGWGLAVLVIYFIYLG